MMEFIHIYEAIHYNNGHLPSFLVLLMF